MLQKNFGLIEVVYSVLFCAIKFSFEHTFRRLTYEVAYIGDQIITLEKF